MKLRTRINLIISALSFAFLLIVLVIEIKDLQQATHDEISAANTVASRLLIRTAETMTATDAPMLILFLESLGRVRAHDIVLQSADGRELYHSPKFTYKAGRDAPDWFVKLLQPNAPTSEYTLPDGTRLIISVDASRAILDAWDRVTHLLLVGVVLVVSLNGLVFWLVSRALAPLPVIVNALDQVRGDLSFRLPPLKGYEAQAIGAAFNNMAVTMEENARLERYARESEARLEERRETALLIEERLEDERRIIARELHDEFAQSVTAIRSLAASIEMHSPAVTPSVSEAAHLISSEAARLYDAMHSLIPRLTPLTLDALGLSATLQGLIDDCQRSHPATKLSLQQNLPASLGPSVAVTIYRVVQEALVNALRHGHPTTIDVTVTCDDWRVTINVIDNGAGLADDWSRPGRFGFQGLRERLTSLHGDLVIINRHSNEADANGVVVRATIPLVHA